MAIQYLDTNRLKTYLTTAWQTHLQTKEDPANGKWYTDGPNHDHEGLYGGLTDELPKKLIVEEHKATAAKHEDMVASSIVDNKNGLNPSNHVTLTYQYSTTTSTTHSFVNAIKTGVNFELNASATFEIFTVGDKESVTVEYTFTYSEEESTLKSQSHTYAQTVDINVPKGKIYQAVLIATVQNIHAPFTADITVTGESETWFEDKVKGRYNWKESAGRVFDWIHHDSQPGSDAHNYDESRSNDTVGIVAIQGTLNNKKIVEFRANVYDITTRHELRLGPVPSPNDAPLVASIPLSPPPR